MIYRLELDQPRPMYDANNNKSDVINAQTYQALERNVFDRSIPLSNEFEYNIMIFEYDITSTLEFEYGVQV